MLSIQPSTSSRDDSKLAWEFDKLLAIELMQHSNNHRALYSVKTNLSTSLSNAVIQSDSTVSRKNININLDYQVAQISDSKIIASGTINSIDSFNITDTPFSNYIAETQSKTKLLNTLVAELRYRLHIILP